MDDVNEPEQNRHDRTCPERDTCHPERQPVILNEVKDLNKDMKEEFDYTKAVEELESIAAKVEDPNTGIGDIEKHIKRSQELIEACRAYLRGARAKVDSLLS